MCGGPCSAEHVRRFLNPSLLSVHTIWGQVTMWYHTGLWRQQRGFNSRTGTSSRASMTFEVEKLSTSFCCWLNLCAAMGWRAMCKVAISGAISSRTVYVILRSFCQLWSSLAVTAALRWHRYINHRAWTWTWTGTGTHRGTTTVFILVHAPTWSFWTCVAVIFVWREMQVRLGHCSSVELPPQGSRCSSWPQASQCNHHYQRHVQTWRLRLLSGIANCFFPWNLY